MAVQKRAVPPPILAVNSTGKEFGEREEFDYHAQIKGANELVATVRKEGQLDSPADFGLSEDVSKVEQIIKKLEGDLKFYETIHKKANQKLLGWIRDHREIRKYEKRVKRTSNDLAQTTISLYSRSRKYADTFDAILKLKAGNLPDPSKENDGDKKTRKPRQDKDLNMGRYKFTGPEIGLACDALLKLHGFVSENTNLFRAHAYFFDAFEDAKTVIEKVAGEMYNYPFDALHHRTIIMMATAEINELARIATSLVRDYTIQIHYIKLDVQKLRSRLGAGREYFDAVKEKRASGGHDIPTTPFPNALSLEKVQEAQMSDNMIQELKDYGISEIKGLRYSEEEKAQSAGGGYGDVYPVTIDQERSIKVAVKVIKHTDVSLKWRAILREAYSWSRAFKGSSKEEILYLLPLIGYCLSFIGNDQCPALVSPWCKDGNLYEFVWGKGKKTSIKTKMALLCDAARGLEFLHTRSPNPIVHGDLKATNVLIYEGRAALADFGIAKCLDGVEGHTPTAKIWYTERYRPPELRHQYIKYPTQKSDMYAFGALILETLTGRPPFGHLSDTQFKGFIEMDKTPADEEFRSPNCPPLDEKHWELMQQCFNFHQHDRPTISESLDTLEGLRDPYKIENNKTDHP